MNNLFEKVRQLVQQWDGLEHTRLSELQINGLAVYINTFARLAMEEEREECAKIADSCERIGGADVIHPSVIADMIRARGKGD